MPVPAAALLATGVAVVVVVVISVVVVLRHTATTSRAVTHLAQRLAEAESRSAQLREELARANDAVRDVRTTLHTTDQDASCPGASHHA